MFAELTTMADTLLPWKHKYQVRLVRLALLLTVYLRDWGRVGVFLLIVHTTWILKMSIEKALLMARLKQSNLKKTRLFKIYYPIHFPGTVLKHKILSNGKEKLFMEKIKLNYVNFHCGYCMPIGGVCSLLDARLSTDKWRRTTQMICKLCENYE